MRAERRLIALRNGSHASANRRTAQGSFLRARQPHARVSRDLQRLREFTLLGARSGGTHRGSVSGVTSASRDARHRLPARTESTREPARTARRRPTASRPAPSTARPEPFASREGDGSPSWTGLRTRPGERHRPETPGRAQEGLRHPRGLGPRPTAPGRTRARCWSPGEHLAARPGRGPSTGRAACRRARSLRPGSRG